MFKVKSTKWYGWFWPPERRKIKIMQAIIDLKEDDIKKRFDEDMKNLFLYGTKPTYTKWDNK